MAPHGEQNSQGGLEGLLLGIQSRSPLGVGLDPEQLVSEIDSDEPVMYRNKHDSLEIDFEVQRLSLPMTTALDPRVVRIAPGKRNERHRHAHETLFIVISGFGEFRVGETWVAGNQGQLVFVPRWVMHQTRNASDTQELVVLAVTDFGLTRSVMGDYDRRTRLAECGADASP